MIGFDADCAGKVVDGRREISVVFGDQTQAKHAARGSRLNLQCALKIELGLFEVPESQIRHSQISECDIAEVRILSEPKNGQTPRLSVLEASLAQFVAHKIQNVPRFIAVKSLGDDELGNSLIGPVFCDQNFAQI